MGCVVNPTLKGVIFTKSILWGSMTFNPAEVKLLSESLVSLEYLIEKVPDPELRQSFCEQRARCKDRLAELEFLQKAATQS
jgi:glutathione S-transferase